MTFSGAIKLSGLDDHITPSQACVVALDNGGKVKLEDFSEEVQVCEWSRIARLALKLVGSENSPDFAASGPSWLAP